MQKLGFTLGEHFSTEINDENKLRTDGHGGACRFWVPIPLFNLRDEASRLEMVAKDIGWEVECLHNLQNSACADGTCRGAQEKDVEVEQVEGEVFKQPGNGLLGLSRGMEDEEEVGEVRRCTVSVVMI